MYISHLRLTNYRNFASLSLELPPGLVVLSGANAQGKTNLLEAAYLLAIAKSYRTNVERELISWASQKAPEAAGTAGMEQTVIDGEVERRDDKVRIIVGLRAGSSEGAGGVLVNKQVKVNGVSTSASGLVGWVNAVLFTASDIELVHGSPSQRRRFLDILLSQVDRGYLRTLQRYQRVLTQRNHLLRLIREGRASGEELGFWNKELVREGAALINHRGDAIDRLAPLTAHAYGALSKGEKLSLKFRPSLSSEQLEQSLAERKNEEINAGMTLAGPHRDDLEIKLNGMPAGTYSSRGQARSIALGLRLAEAVFLKEQRGDEPVLLLDDVLSELDSYRRQSVLEEAAGYQQALVTTAEPALIGDLPARNASLFYVNAGTVTPRREGNGLPTAEFAGMGRSADRFFIPQLAFTRHLSF